MEKVTWVLKCEGEGFGKGVLVTSDWSELTQELFRVLQNGRSVMVERI